MEQEDYQSAGILLIIGALLGAGLALLYAPHPGRETRQGLRDKAQRTWDRVKSSPEAINERVGELLDTIAENSQQLVREAGTLTQERQAELRAAIESARNELERLRKRIAKMD
ncbi:MAG: YtxH domain-containing protein [Pseudomonadota bacterium]